MTPDDLLVVIPARGGSKRLPGKNLRALDGQSLLARTADALRGSGVAATCILSTDDDAIAEAGAALGWQVPFRRPANLSDDAAPTAPVVRHALDWFCEERGRDPQYVLVLQATSPFRGSMCIARALTLLAQNPQAQAVVAMTRLDRAPRHLFAQDARGYATALLESDTPRPLFTPNGALYLVRTDVFRETGSLFPPRTLPLPMDCVAAIDIDDEDDWRLAEAVAAFGLSGTVRETP